MESDRAVRETFLHQRETEIDQMRQQVEDEWRVLEESKTRLRPSIEMEVRMELSQAEAVAARQYQRLEEIKEKQAKLDEKLEELKQKEV